MEPFFKSQAPRLRRFNCNGCLESLRGYEPLDISHWRWCLQKKKKKTMTTKTLIEESDDDDGKFFSIFPPVSSHGTTTSLSPAVSAARSLRVGGDRIVYWGHMKFPILNVKRVDNWGWVLESSAVVFCSFSLKEYLELSKRSL